MNHKQSLNLLRDTFLSLFYPRECALCSKSVESYDDGATCAICWEKTRIFNVSDSLCRKCGRLLENTVTSGVSSDCHRCNNDFYVAARALGVYEGALRVAILELKEKPFVAPRLERLLMQAFNDPVFAHVTKLLPVPLHPKREKMRGFNQAAVLAQFLSAQTSLPIAERALSRKLYTKQHRAGMDEKARLESVSDAFLVKQHQLVKNEKILLIDDVFTSGATASVCAKTLLDNGAEAVFVLTLARTI